MLWSNPDASVESIYFERIRIQGSDPNALDGSRCFGRIQMPWTDPVFKISFNPDPVFQNIV